MGFDEHGPAYPEPEGFPSYSPLDNSVHRMIEASRKPPEPVEPPLWARLLFGAFVLVTLIWLFSTPCAHAMNHGFDPDDPTIKWFESKIRPDSPPNSCCGKGDAYPVERYECPEPKTGKGCTVWLADGSAKLYPDGTRRDYFDKSVPITVPFNKVNPDDDDLDNPTDMSWLFMRVSTPTEAGTIYCFIKHPSGN